MEYVCRKLIKLQLIVEFRKKKKIFEYIKKRDLELKLKIFKLTWFEGNSDPSKSY